MNHVQISDVVKTPYGFIIYLPSDRPYFAARFHDDPDGLMRLIKWDKEKTTVAIDRFTHIADVSRLIEEFYIKSNNLWEGQTTIRMTPRDQLSVVQRFEKGTLEYRAFEALLEASEKI